MYKHYLILTAVIFALFPVNTKAQDSRAISVMDRMVNSYKSQLSNIRDMKTVMKDGTMYQKWDNDGYKMRQENNFAGFSQTAIFMMANIIIIRIWKAEKLSKKLLMPIP